MLKKYIVLCALFLLTQLAFAQSVAPITIDVSVSQPAFVIKLGSNPSTGYMWQVAPFDKTMLTLREHHYTPGAQRPGATGTDNWTFQVNPSAFNEPKDTKLTFIYKRPWTNTDPTTTQEYVIHFTK